MNVCGLLSKLPQVMLDRSGGHMMPRGHLQGGFKVKVTRKQSTPPWWSLYTASTLCLYHSQLRTPVGGGETQCLRVGSSSKCLMQPPSQPPCDAPQCISTKSIWETSWKLLREGGNSNELFNKKLCSLSHWLLMNRSSVVLSLSAVFLRTSFLPFGCNERGRKKWRASPSPAIVHKYLFKYETI